MSLVLVCDFICSFRVHLKNLIPICSFSLKMPELSFPHPCTSQSTVEKAFHTCHATYLKRIQFFLKAARLLKCFSIYPSSCNYHPHCHLVSYSPFAIYMYTYMCTCVYIYVCVCTHIYVHEYIDIHMYIQTHTHIYKTHIYTCIYRCTYVYVDITVCVCV